jgi:hypothetical protein
LRPQHEVAVPKRGAQAHPWLGLPPGRSTTGAVINPGRVTPNANAYYMLRIEELGRFDQDPIMITSRGVCNSSGELS